MLASVFSDLRYGWRTLRRSPGFAAVSVLALALGIGANSAIFTVVNSVLLRPLRFPDSDRLILVIERNLKAGFPRFSLSPGNYLDYRDHNHSFTGLTAFSQQGLNLSGGSAPERLHGAQVTGDFFDVLGVKPQLGRSFAGNELKPGSDHVAILSQALWKRRFGGDGNVLGQTLKLNQEVYTIVGVTPPGFTFPETTQVWTPLTMKEEQWRHRGGHFLSGVARLKPGATVETAEADLNSIAARAEKEFPESNTGWDTTEIRLQEALVGDVRPAMLTLTAAVAFVLLIACVNLANLLLSRAVARRREIGIRASLGAGRARLVRQLLTESLLLAGLGAIAGLAIAWVGMRFLLRLGPDILPRADEIGLDGTVVAFTAAVAAITGILFGLVPARHMARTDLASFLRSGGRGASIGFRGNRMRSVLVISEMALALVLLTGAALLMRSFYQLRSADPGFDARGVLTFSVDLPPLKYKTDAQQIEFYSRALEKLRALPGVTAAGATDVFPLGGDDTVLTFEQVGKPPAPVGKSPSASFRRVTPGYFKSLRIALKRGRDFDDRDNASTPPVAVISESMARQFYANENPLGQFIRISGSKPAGIVGIIADVRDQQLASKGRPAVYQSALQAADEPMAYAVRTSGDPASLIASARAAIREIDPELPLDAVGTMDSLVLHSLSTERLAMFLMALFAALALGLAMVGIYGVISYSVTQATQEIGIRMALGARSVDVLRMVFGYMGVLVGVGLAIGLPAAWGAGQLLSSQLFEVKPSDPTTYLGAAAVLLATGLLACALPAARAMLVDPLTALREE